jgi:hypothetical protein
MKTKVIRRDGELLVVIPEELARGLPDEVYIEVRGEEIIISVEEFRPVSSRAGD